MKYINVIPLVLALVFSFFNSASAFDFAPTTAWLGTNFFHASNSVTAISAIGAVSNSVASSGNTNLLGTDQNGNQVSIKITSINGGGSGQSYGAGAGISTNTFSISVTGWLLNILGTGAITNASELSGNFDTFGAGLAAAQAATNGLPWWGNTYQTAVQVSGALASYVPITQTNVFVSTNAFFAFTNGASNLSLSSYLLGNQSISITGIGTGSGTTAITLSSNATSVGNINYQIAQNNFLTANQTITLGGVAGGSGTTSITVTTNVTWQQDVTNTMVNSGMNGGIVTNANAFINATGFKGDISQGTGLTSGQIPALAYLPSGTTNANAFISGGFTGSGVIGGLYITNLSGNPGIYRAASGNVCLRFWANSPQLIDSAGYDIQSDGNGNYTSQLTFGSPKLLATTGLFISTISTNGYIAPQIPIASVAAFLNTVAGLGVVAQTNWTMVTWTNGQNYLVATNFLNSGFLWAKLTATQTTSP